MTHPRLNPPIDCDMTDNPLNIYSTNIHSLPDKFDRLTIQLNLLEQKPSIIVLTDNYLNAETDPCSFPLHGYTTYHTSDVSVYTDKLLHTSMKSIQTRHSSTAVIQIHKTAETNDPIHTMIGTYRRPSMDKKDFITEMQTVIDSIYNDSPRTSITIIGDININLLKMTSDIYHFLIENSLYTTITTPTRYDPIHNNTATLIDTILTTMTEVDITAGTLSPPITDHLPIYASIQQVTPRTSQNRPLTLSKTTYEKNKQAIIHDIENEIERTFEHGASTAQHIENMQKAMQRTIERHEKRPKERRKNWCSPKLKRQIKKQHQLHRQRIQNPTKENIEKHARYRNRLNWKIKEQKKKYIERQLEDAKNEPKKQVQILDTVLPRKSNDRTTPMKIQYEEKTITDPTEIANAMNDHYITIGQKTAAAIPPQNEEMKENEENKHPPFRLKEITEENVSETLKKMNPHKANDIYKIQPRIIKDMTPFLSPILSKLFNKAIKENEYPDALKSTKAIEIYKAKDKTLPENYRPISLLPIIAKTLDTIINTQLMQHLLQHNMLSPTQYAFRPKSNCTMALQTIIDEIIKQKTQKHPTLAIYVDLSKAYDTVSHDRLISKLKNEFNFTAETTQFFQSYLTNRQQSLHTQHATSSTRIISHGIPQGSTLSPTLFILYINNIIKTVPKSKVYTYADDTTLIISAHTLDELKSLAQSELNNLIKYFHINNLVPNSTKTNYTVFYPREHTDIQLKVNEQSIERHREARLLGLMVQDKLKHDQTIITIIRKLQPMLQKFRYANKFLSTRVMVQQYYTHVYSHLTGTITIWGSDKPNCTRIQPLIRTQKRFIRLIKNLPPREHTSPIMKELEILSIPNIYTLRMCTEAHPHMHDNAIQNLPENNHHYTRVDQIHTYPTRHSLQGYRYIPNERQNPELNVSHFTKQYIRVWNKLPKTLRDIPKLETFKTELKRHLLNQQQP